MRCSSLIRTPKPYSLLHATKEFHQQHNSDVMRFKGECSYIEAEVYGVKVSGVLKTHYSRGIEDSLSSMLFSGRRCPRKTPTSVLRGIAGEHPSNAIPGTKVPTEDPTALTGPDVTVSNTKDQYVTQPQSSPNTTPEGITFIFYKNT
ncbi:hypothetical protein PVL30_000334 [Lodderomyces elongisporus]|uniref:uncharacterized protein n=1 Tax=Lodderomyces elongisporus TaxID=36914 RepID=UPI0029206D4C|nr:uncharacterized protein PVL30_000334 [Lodderomyces elongisporus]WLF76632.1 hypothetical protein PVL30_000334 [Lodderomyces elongisporus]